MRTESLRTVDKPAGLLSQLAGKVRAPRRLADLLRGAWLGHPVHPVLVTVPIGAWTGSLLLDCTGQRAAARQLLGLGLMAVPAAVVTGIADYPDTTAQQRVGAVHATANTIATILIAASYLCRRANRHGAGVILSALGVAAAGGGGALGGHLAYAQGVGVHRYQNPPFVRRP